MTTFNITIDNTSFLNGITAARDSYNTLLPATIIDSSGNEIVNPDLILTDEKYVEFVMNRAAESYAKQYGV